MFVPFGFFAFAASLRLADVQVVNVVPAFLAAWDEGAGKSINDRVSLVKERVFYPNRRMFESPIYQLDDLRLAWYLDDVAQYVPAMRRIDEALEATLPDTIASFRKTFPDFKSDAPIYVGLSLLKFDGLETDGVMRIGVDGVAKFDGVETNPSVVVDHELFHVYHDSTLHFGVPIASPVWQRLWEEGLASYVSAQLNPGTTDAQALVSADLAAVDATKIKSIACNIDGHLFSTGPQYYEMYFDQEEKTTLPQRSGYLIGYLVAKKLGASNDLLALAKMNGEPLRVKIFAAVDDLCGGKT